MNEIIGTLGMREWLISVGLLLVLAVLIDGLRRMLKDRKNNIKMSRHLNLDFSDNSTDQTPELPNGGSRVINRADPIISEQIEEDLFIEDSDASMHIKPEDKHKVLRPEPEDIIVIHVKAKAKDGFVGTDLLQVLLSCDLRFGEKDIFHRYEDTKDKSSLQFSLANMLEPGTFDLDNINSFRTPGVTFFMTLPTHTNPLDSFNHMLETASSLVNTLSAKMFDEEHKAMSQKILSKYKDRVAIFEDYEIDETI